MAGRREAQSLHQFQQIIAKLHSNEGIQKGVYTAAQEGDALAYIHGKEEFVIEVTHCVVVRAQSHHYVIRQLTENEHSHDSKDHLQGFVTFKVPGLHEGLNNAAVTENHYKRRQDKAQHHLADHHGDTEIFVPIAVCHTGVVGVDIRVDYLR